MKIEIRNDTAHISGYVNAVGRDSRPLMSPNGEFVEMIEPGTFRAALEKSGNVDVLLNHRKDRKIAATSDGTATLAEDNIGLRAEVDITDAETVEKARSGKLRGWSFGMYVLSDEFEQRSEGVPRRHVKDMDMFEVSIIDDTMLPCYAGTSVECRSEGEVLAETRANDDNKHEITEDAPKGTPDYSEWEKRLAVVRARPSIEKWEQRVAGLAEYG